MLGLPPELRQHIYEKILELPASDHVSLLCVCKKIFHEGRAYFYRRPLNCDSQEALDLFVLSHSPEALQQIQTLNVRFQEIDPTMMQPALALLATGLSINSYQHPYFHEVERITRNLASMPEIRHLSILRPVERLRNPPSRDFFETICSWIQEKYTQLRTLKLSIENTSLHFLSSLSDLRMLDYSGFSVTRPEEMLHILTELRHLEELRITGPLHGLRRRSRSGFEHRFVVQSFTDGVLHGLRPLKSLTICELSVPTQDESTFLTDDMLKALYLTHRDSLRDLNITSETRLEPPVESLLRALLMSTTTLVKLRVGWPWMDISFLDSLPGTLRHLEIVAPDLSFRESVTHRLSSPGNRLPHLRNVSFA